MPCTFFICAHHARSTLYAHARLTTAVTRHTTLGQALRQQSRTLAAWKYSPNVRPRSGSKQSRSLLHKRHGPSKGAQWAAARRAGQKLLVARMHRWLRLDCCLPGRTWRLLPCSRVLLRVSGDA